MVVNNYLPQGKSCAIIFTIDDLHPASAARDGYDAGGDLDKGAFGHVDALLKKHPELKVTLYTTASWREIAPYKTDQLTFKVPAVYDRRFIAPITPKDYFNLCKYKDFVTYYNQHPQVEIGLHGYEHIHKGSKMPVEFQNQDTYADTAYKVDKMYEIFHKAGLNYVNGFTPPAWNAPEKLMKVLIKNGLKFLTSARDLNTPITRDAQNNMSGMKKVSILYPQMICDDKVVHIPTNFQITSAYERAFEIMELGGILSIKAHMVKNFNGFDQIDGVTKEYMDFIDELLTQLKQKYNDKIWWTTPNEIADKILNHEHHH